jgi:hypothetical protein
MPVSDKLTELSPSRALLSAALGAFLWISAPGCTGNNPTTEPPTVPSGGSGDGGGGGSGSGSSGVDAGLPFECDGGVSPNPTVTSTTTVGTLTLAQFTSQCTGLNGVVEIQPHCGGSNNCRGMSYDSDLGTILQHTCRATNTCAGFSCIICG